MTDLTKLREDAEQITTSMATGWIAPAGTVGFLAQGVLSLLDAQSAGEEALRAAGKALKGAQRWLPAPSKIVATSELHGVVANVEDALVSVNAVLAGKNTEKAEVRHLTLDEQRTFEAALRKSGTIVAVAKPLSTSALDEERALLDELTLYGGRLDPGGAPAAASNWITRRDALLARLSANPKGPKE